MNKQNRFNYNDTIKLICIDYIIKDEEIYFKMIFHKFLNSLINIRSI